jgi:hypothetical protein
VEPQFIIHGEVSRRFWDRPLQVVNIRVSGDVSNLKALSVIVNIDDA